MSEEESDSPQYSTEYRGNVQAEPASTRRGQRRGFSGGDNAVLVALPVSDSQSRAGHQEYARAAVHQSRYHRPRR